MYMAIDGIDYVAAPSPSPYGLRVHSVIPATKFLDQPLIPYSLVRQLCLYLHSIGMRQWYKQW